MLQIPNLKPGPQVNYRKYVSDDTHKICSVFPKEVHLHNHNGEYMIPGKKPGERFSFVEIRPGLEKYELGEERYLVAQNILSIDVAKDYVGLTRGSEDLANRGVFVPEGDEPTEEEIVAAEKRLFDWLQLKLDEGDREFSNTGKINHIDDNAKLASKLLGMEREWLGTSRVTAPMECPVCGNTIRKGSRICPVGQKGCGSRLGYDEAGNVYWMDEKLTAHLAEQPRPAIPEPQIPPPPIKPQQPAGVRPATLPQK